MQRPQRVLKLPKPEESHLPEQTQDSKPHRTEGESQTHGDWKTLPQDGGGCLEVFLPRFAKGHRDNEITRCQ